MHFLVLERKTLAIIFIVCCSLFMTSIWLFTSTKAITTINQNEDKIREIQLVTGEFKAKNSAGKEIESYRFDPGTIFIKEGEKVRLTILGINGKEHPFLIEGTNIKGTVKQNEETVIPLQFNEEGVYRLICMTHSDKDHSGPMIAYIIVD